MTDTISPRYQLHVKQRRRVVESAEDYGFRAAARHFGLARRTVRTWCRRWKADGDQGLVPRYPARRRRRVSEGIVELARVARTEYRWGATRTRIWLERVHRIRVNARPFSASSVTSVYQPSRRQRSANRNSSSYLRKRRPATPFKST